VVCLLLHLVRVYPILLLAVQLLNKMNMLMQLLETSQVNSRFLVSEMYFFLPELNNLYQINGF